MAETKQAQSKAKTTAKKTTITPKATEKKKVAPKPDLNKKIKELEEQIKNLKKQNINLEVENQKNLIEFQALAKTFQTKAQEQINARRKEDAEKLESEKESIKKYGSQKLLESIIEPILNIEQAIKAGKNQEAVSAYVTGFEMLMNQLYNELEGFGAKIISPKLGDQFDPELHYSMSVIEGGKSQTISEVKKRGLKLHDRVLKPATVITYK